MWRTRAPDGVLVSALRVRWVAIGGLLSPQRNQVLSDEEQACGAEGDQTQDRLPLNREHEYRKRCKDQGLEECVSQSVGFRSVFHDPTISLALVRGSIHSLVKQQPRSGRICWEDGSSGADEGSGSSLARVPPRSVPGCALIDLGRDQLRRSDHTQIAS